MHLRVTAPLLSAALALGGCGGSSVSTPLPSSSSGTARARFVEAAPDLEALINGVPTQLESVYLRVNGQTLASSFDYSTITQYFDVNPGTASVSALDTNGYRVGPLKASGLSAGKKYTLILAGSYPNYSILTYAEPPSSADGELSLYEASPSVPKAEFGTFAASSHSHFKQLGSASLGSVVTVTLGQHVANVGGYVDAALRRVAERSDGWLTYFYAPDAFETSWRQIREYAEAPQMIIRGLCSSARRAISS